MTPVPQGPGSFRIRPARRGDAVPIVALLAQQHITTDANTVTWNISHPEMEIFVSADQLDRPIGFATLSHRPLLKTGGRAASIDELNVATGWQRKGVGRALLAKVVERAKVLTVKRLEVQTYGAATPEVTAFFRACGFDATDVGVFRLK